VSAWSTGSRRAIQGILVVLASGTLLAGCKESADGFFSGRPSGMAMVHNRIIGGPPEAMLELLRVPSRFPDARPAKALESWTRFRHPDRSREKARILAEIEAALTAR
jgi:hypothetical protein